MWLCFRTFSYRQTCYTLLHLHSYIGQNTFFSGCVSIRFLVHSYKMLRFFTHSISFYTSIVKAYEYSSSASAVDVHVRRRTSNCRRNRISSISVMCECSIRLIACLQGSLTAIINWNRYVAEDSMGQLLPPPKKKLCCFSVQRSLDIKLRPRKNVCIELHKK